mmetsp:Transcript_4748/g.6258  ORF Transcript_4748/g.6258 Transcript_4748/m.6258 type:complete len:315 (+) Transcript_4748:1409-2353(+)
MQVVLIVLNVFLTSVFILRDVFNDTKKIRSGFWRDVTIPFTAVYLAEAVMVVLSTSGKTLMRDKKLHVLEIILQLCSGLAYVKMFRPSSEQDYAMGSSLLSFVFLLRNLRLSILLQEVRSFKVIVDMLMKMTSPFVTQLLNMYLIYYVFAQVGMYGLSGVIREPNFHSEGSIPNNLFYLINFNDLSNSLSALYTYMIISNSPPSTTMYVNALGGERWPRVYFWLFYILMSWIVLNIIIAMIIDVYDNVENELGATFGNLKKVKQLMAVEKRIGQAEFRALCDQVNKKLLVEEVERVELENKAVIFAKPKASQRS